MRASPTFNREGATMFSNLVESKAKASRRTGGTIFSFIAHYGLLLGMIYTSAEAARADDGPKPEKVAFVEPERPEVKPESRRPDLLATLAPPKSVPILLPPIDVPTSLPEIDLSRRITDPDDFVHRSQVPNNTSGSGRDSVVPDGQVYFDFQTEKPVMQAPNSASPAYPDILRQAGVEGEALVSFVVDTSGRVDPATFKVIRATHDLFAAAVKNVLPRMRFIPAELGDRKVRQLVQQPFSFAIVK
jgi:protein TonB